MWCLRSGYLGGRLTELYALGHRVEMYHKETEETPGVDKYCQGSVGFKLQYEVPIACN
jgi:hypothetical protein